jgi:hypothetical protein
MKPQTLIFLAAAAGLAHAQIDSGGGKVQIGTLTNHASIGGIVATGTHQVGANSNHSGLIEVLYSAGPPIDPDANANGLADAWEEQYFPGQTPDPQADSDDDGVSNLREYIAGTNPTSKSSAFKPSGSSSNGIYSMPMQTVAGRIYKIYASKDLTTWHLQETIEGDGTSTTFTLDQKAITSGPLYSINNPSTLFYRVEVILP